MAMKIKVGDKTYDGSDVPIMLICEHGIKSFGESFDDKATRYAIFPDKSQCDVDYILMNRQEKEEWMDRY